MVGISPATPPPPHPPHLTKITSIPPTVTYTAILIVGNCDAGLDRELLHVVNPNQLQLCSRHLAQNLVPPLMGQHQLLGKEIT